MKGGFCVTTVSIVSGWRELPAGRQIRGIIADVTARSHFDDPPMLVGEIKATDVDVALGRVKLRPRLDQSRTGLTSSGARFAS